MNFKLKRDSISGDVKSQETEIEKKKKKRKEKKEKDILLGQSHTDWHYPLRLHSLA